MMATTAHRLLIHMPNIVKRKNDAVAWHSNEFLNAAYSMTRDEKRILWMCMSAIGDAEDKHSPAFEITVKRYTQMFGVPSAEATNDIRGALSKLLRRSITIYRPDESTEDEEAWDMYSILMRTAKRPKRGVYEIDVNPYLLPFFYGLKREFTKLQLLEVADLRNPHAMRLYENLIQFESTGTFCKQLEWFIDRYQLPESYSRYANFKQKFLDVAVAEINAKTPLSVGYVENKTGRKVASILFSFSRKSAQADC
ncbi:RepB family plasmid replication initiator protein [Aeromonas rivipollensis]|uniref:RepB family plasmid replication initiator protein n=1 Tax=Aeromonas rivipollensis TaxID=948519 RepID=UPI0038D13589